MTRVRKRAKAEDALDAAARRERDEWLKIAAALLDVPVPDHLERAKGRANDDRRETKRGSRLH